MIGTREWKSKKRSNAVESSLKYKAIRTRLDVWTGVESAGRVKARLVVLG